MPEKYNLTPNEKSILRQLESDSRMSFSKIAKKTRKSQQRVSYNVNSLIKKGVIKNFYTLIDYSKLGVISFRVYFKISYVSQARFREFVDFLRLQADTAWISSCGGDYDIICTFFASNPSQFNKKLRKVMAEFPKLIKDYTILTTIVIRNFEREYLLSGANIPKEVIIGGDRKPEIIDDTDMHILNLICDNARINSVELANKLSLTPRTVIKRIKDLRERKIIIGFRPLLNLQKIGYISTLLLIRYHNMTVELERKLVNYLKIHLNIVGVVKTLGEWDLEIEIEVKSRHIFRKIEIEIREKFTSLIHEIRSVPLYGVFKKIFFPKFLVERPKSIK